MTYEFGAFRFDAARLELRRDGELLTLNRRALQLLGALVERRGELITKEELLRAVWGERGATLNNLSQHLFMLRNALREREGEEQPFILTVPRIGYRFIAEVRGEAAEPPAFVLAGHYRANAEHLWRMRTEPSIASAMVLYERAIQEYPDDAQAYAGLGVCRLLQAEYMYAPGFEALTAAEQEALRALERDANNVRALDVLGVCAASLRYAWREGEQLLSSAIEKQPDALWPHVHLVQQYIAQGQIDRARTALARAQSLSSADDPYPRLPLLRGTLHYVSGAYRAAIADLGALVAEHPTYSLARHTLARAYLADGDHAQAQQHIDEVLRAQFDPLRPGQPNVRERAMALNVWTRAASGDAAGARRALAELETIAQDPATSRICLAFGVLALGDKGRALKLLADGVRRHDSLYGIANAEPLFAPLRSMSGWAEIAAALQPAS